MAKKQIKLTKDSRIKKLKSREQGSNTKKNQDHGSKVEIENKLEFNKRANNQN
jgi:hypothetical protein